MLHFSAKALGLKILPVDLPFEPWPIGIVMLKDRTLRPGGTALHRVRARGRKATGKRSIKVGGQLELLFRSTGEERGDIPVAGG